MELNDWLAITGAFKGIGSCPLGFIFCVNRKTHGRRMRLPIRWRMRTSGSRLTGWKSV